MTVREELQRNHESFSEKVEQIRQDWTRSDEAKRQDLQEAYNEARSTYARLVDEYRSDLSTRVQENRRRTFAPPKVSDDAGINAMVYRDALQRTAQTTEQRDLREMLELAATTGDVALSRAVLHRAYTLENPALVGAYFEHHPGDLKQWTEFMDSAEQLNNLNTYGTEMSVGVPSPEEPRELNPNRTPPRGGFQTAGADARSFETSTPQGAA